MEQVQAVPVGRVAAVLGLAVFVMFVSRGGPLVDGEDRGESSWVSSGLQDAAGRTALCLCSMAALLVLGWLYRLLFCPLELLRSLDQVGYVVPEGRCRAQAVNEVRRRRKTGDLPPVYPNGWYRVLDSHLLRRGDVRSLTVLGQQVAVFRGQEGRAFVLDAYCPHLGANLAVGGRVVGNCIECPFHGWQFEGSDGKCAKVPYSDKVPDFARVRRWPCAEVNGQIYLWFHCDGVEPQWDVPEQEEISRGEWVYRGRTEHYVSAHIQEIPENAADIAHLGHLHRPGMIGGVDLRYTKSRAWEFMQHDWKVEWRPEPEPHAHCSQMLVKHALHLFGVHWSLLDVSVVARQTGPGVVFIRFDHRFLGSGVIMHCVTPLEPLLQLVTHTIFYQASVPAPVPKFILKSECIQFERDVMVWNNKRYNPSPLLVKEDSAIQRHRRWFSQFYSENSPRLQYQRDSADF
ncbi:cholesterol 7-desaturase nvd [Eucyclogobius newberryi]|uniref:cholesterol 7-desaturase nvd n=1 Tax=Eucyclogobius newberryi TaxID=166745 RepID=UPI003B5A41BC